MHEIAHNAQNCAPIEGEMQRQDRRILRTRAALDEALIGLLETADYEVITVQAICDAANVGRSAFYQHYTGKDDLFRSGFDRFRQDLDTVAAVLEPEDHGGVVPKLVDAIFMHAEKHARLYRSVTTGNGGFIALRIIEGIIAQCLERALSARSDLSPPNIELSALMYSSAIMTALRWWFQHHNRPDRGEMVRQVQATIGA